MLRVTSVKKLSKQDLTVDIEVGGKNGSHSYLLSNNVISHNTISLLAGATPGIHYPISKTYIRRLRLDKNSKLLPNILDAGFNVEPCFGSESTTVVIEFPQHYENNIPLSKEVSLEQKLQEVALFQNYWSDNQVSVTLNFDVEKEGQLINNLLKKYDNQLKSISFLPEYNNGELPYPQMPYEEISYDKYTEMMSKIDFKKLYCNNNINDLDKDQEVESDIFCDGDKCTRS